MTFKAFLKTGGLSVEKKTENDDFEFDRLVQEEWDEDGRCRHPDPKKVEAMRIAQGPKPPDGDEFP